MNRRLIVKVLFTSLIVVALYLAVGLAPRSGEANAPGQKLALQAPAFLAPGSAYAAPDGIGEKLDAEAGISAWYHSVDPLNLTQLVNSGICTTIETNTPDYIICSVDVPNYLEHFDPHVYAHKDGWILAYYLKADPVSKIIDVKARSIDGTILKNIVAVVASAGGVAFSDVSYYDFRYPNATHMLFVAENNASGNDFSITIPSNYSYFERSWSSYASNFIVNGTNFPGMLFAQDYCRYGILNASQLLPNVQHTIQVSDYGVLVLVYRVP